VPPGASEHQCGLAVDVRTDEHASLNFIKSDAGRWLAKNAHKYGFIVRYPYWGENETGVTYEPWHLRYVGAPHAEIMAKSGLSYEEYVDYLTPEVWFSHGEYLILRTAAETLTLPNEWQSCHISPDNTGYYIVTLKTR
jgi:D-alanyl-D-alanine carboxypeptidase